MQTELLEGYALGIAYAAPIGAQNLFVISQSINVGIPRNIPLALLVTLMDVSLAIAAVLGIGALLEGHAILKSLIGTAGGFYLLYIAFESFKALKISRELRLNSKVISWAKISRSAFFLTWLNPHAIIDGTAILGGYSSKLGKHDKLLFIIGVSAASLSWFITLSFISSLFNRGKTELFLQVVKIFSAITIFYFAINIIFSSISEWLNS